MGLCCVWCMRDKRSRFMSVGDYEPATDRLDALTSATVLVSGEARAGSVPRERVATYRELVRLHTQREPLRQQPLKLSSRRL